MSCVVKLLRCSASDDDILSAAASKEVFNPTCCQCHIHHHKLFSFHFHPPQTAQAVLSAAFLSAFLDIKLKLQTKTEGIFSLSEASL